MHKVVLPAEAERMDRHALRAGCSEEAFIEEAGRKVAAAAMELAPKAVTLLVGKGNKGADCLAAGLVLAQQGVAVEALCLFSYDDSTSVCRLFRDRFAKQGKLIPVETLAQLLFSGDLIIDGLFGTGFMGIVTGFAEAAIRIANSSCKPILAIDLPSGLNGTTGKVESVAIVATLTVALGFAKIGCFLRDGWNHVGRVRVEDFGLPVQWAQEAHAIASLSDVRSFPLPRIIRNRHKYEAGYLVGFAGSSYLRGASKLAGMAALRAGAGIVRIFHKGAIGESPPELICQPWSERAWRQEMQRASALFIGPGLGKTACRFIEKLLIPLVVDADGLQAGLIYPKRTILTPHRGEMARLLGLHAVPVEEELLERCTQFVERHQVILLLKGAPTFLFAHGKTPLILTHGDPGMASAGTGDVLTGIIGALLAQNIPPYEAAAFGAYLHGMAGEIAAAKKTSYGMIASDLIEALPEAWGKSSSPYGDCTFTSSKTRRDWGNEGRG